MTPENTHATLDGTRQYASHFRIPPDRAVTALLRIGTRRCRFAAALMAVVVGLASQIGNQAVAQAKQNRLYLDAPAVSAERASRAREVANSYSKPESPASRDILAWLKVPVHTGGVSPLPEGTREAFASIIARDGEGAGGVTPDDALAAGELMLAQLEGSPTENGDDEDGGEELASAGAVRPQLGDGEQTSKVNGNDDAEEERPGNTDSPTYAGSPAYASAQGAFASAREPSGGSGVVISAPSPAGEEPPDEAPEQVPPTELASAPSYTGATPAPDSGTGEETYGPTGPISDAGQVPTIPTPAGPEDAGDGDEQPYLDESVPASEPESVPDAAEEESAGTKPSVEDTGPTSGEGEDLALVPVPPPADEEPAAEGDPEQAEDQAPVASPNDGGGSQTAHEEPLPPTEAETAYAEPLPRTEEVSQDSADSDVPEAASTEGLVAEADEERIEIVIGGDEAPAGTLSEDEAPSEYVPPAEAPPGRKEAGEDAPPYQDPQWSTEQEQPPSDEPSGDDTQWGRPVEEDPSDYRQPVGDVPPVEEPPYDVSPGGPSAGEALEDEPPESVSLPEEQPFADEEVSPEVPPEGQQPGVDEQTEDPEYAMSAPPGDRAPRDPQERGQGGQRGKDLRQDGPRHGQDRRSEADPMAPVEEVERNDGEGGALQGEAQHLIVDAVENGGATQEEQPAFAEEGGSSGGMSVSEPLPVPDPQTSEPEPLSQATPRTTEEPVAAAPVPQITPTPAQATVEEPTARQHDEPARPASTRQYDPASQPATVAPASQTGVPTASEPAAPEQSPEQEGAARRSLAEPGTEPMTEQRGGKENR